MRDLHSNLVPTRAIQAQTIAAAALVSGDLDLAGFQSAEVLVDFGDIDEMGNSPEGGAQIAIKLEHADDDGSGGPAAYAEVTLPDVLGPGSVAGGVVATTTSDLVPIAIGYVGGRRFLRVTLTPTGLTNGGPVGCWLLKGRPRHAAVA